MVVAMVVVQPYECSQAKPNNKGNMMNKMPILTRMNARHMALLLLCTLTAACAQIGDGLRYTSENINKLRYDASYAWYNLGHYEPPATFMPQPQLRYCYAFSSDIVCYDAPQDNVDAPIVAIQEGIPGRLIGGSELVDDTVVFAATAPQHDVETHELDMIGAKDTQAVDAPLTRQAQPEAVPFKTQQPAK
jgi:hypothetical protein